MTKTQTQTQSIAKSTKVVVKGTKKQTLIVPCKPFYGM
jgi:hypothetical protein